MFIYILPVGCGLIDAALKLLLYSRDSKPHAVKLYTVTAPRLLLYYTSSHQIATWDFAQNSSDFGGLLCTIFYTIYIIIGVRLVWTNPAILFTTGKHSLFGILKHLHALLGHSSIIIFKWRQNVTTAISYICSVMIFGFIHCLCGFLFLESYIMQNIIVLYSIYCIFI